MTTQELEEFADIHGNLRRCGSLAPPAGFVSSFQTWESERPVWDDSDIRRALTDSNRTPRRKIFGTRWMQNQRNHGSCNGYAGAGGLSKARWLRGITDGIILSGAFLYSLINGGRDQGSMLEDGLNRITVDGLPPEDLVPWNQIYPNQQPREAREIAKKRRGLIAYACQTKQGFRTAMAAGYPCIVAVHAGSRWQRQNAQGISGVDNGRGNHAVHCDDAAIIGGQEVYDLCNSWGTGFCDDGRTYVTWDSFEQTFGIHTFYAIASTEDADT